MTTPYYPFCNIPNNFQQNNNPFLRNNNLFNKKIDEPKIEIIELIDSDEEKEKEKEKEKKNEKEKKKKK